MSFSDEAKSEIPLLPECHSGIPQFLAEKAKGAKGWVFETRTKPQRERQRLPVLPQGIERDAFFAALDSLRAQIGEANVEVNDKPLKDGW